MRMLLLKHSFSFCILANSSRERKANKSEPFKLDPPVSSSKLTPPTSRPSNLTLNSSAPDLQKGKNGMRIA